MRTAITSAVLVTVAASLICCTVRQQPRVPWEDLTTAERLELIRIDTAYRAYLDSVAGVSIGEGARCLDPVLHLFERDGRHWLLSDDWGGLLELPAGWIPAEDPIQAELSFHGTHVWSPDTMTLVQMYSGFMPCDDIEDYREILREGFAEDSVTVESWKLEEVVLSSEGTVPALTVRGRNMDGINFYGRYILDNIQGVEHCASVQWDDTSADDAMEMIGYIRRFPLGPDGQTPHGDALL